MYENPAQAGFFVCHAEILQQRYIRLSAKDDGMSIADAATSQDMSHIFYRTSSDSLKILVVAVHNSGIDESLDRILPVFRRADWSHIKRSAQAHLNCTQPRL